jgi:acyl-homoserine-lactone acylase
VFREFWRRARSLPNLWRKPFDHEDPVATPAGLDLGPKPAQLALRNALFDALGQGVHAIRGAGFAIDAPLGELQRHASPAGPVALGGGEEAEGVLNALGESGITPLTRQGYDIDQGASYLQLVGFDDDGPVARGLLVYGQSSRADSPFAFDQLPAYAAKQWFALPFKPAEVAAHRIGEPLSLRFLSGLSDPERQRRKWQPL